MNNFINILHQNSGNDAAYRRTYRQRLSVILAGIFAAMATPAFAAPIGGSPWENAVDVLVTAMTGPIAKGLSLIAIVIGGLMFAFGEPGSKKMLSGIVFGVGMAVSAVSFFTWLFQ